MQFAKKIRLLLVECDNISEAELARRVGETPQNFNKRMKRDNFDVETLQKIANALNVNLVADVYFEFPDGTKI